jgi:hypothetical protein
VNVGLDLAKIKIGDTISGSPIMANLSSERAVYTCAENNGVEARFDVSYFGVFLGPVYYSNASANENGWRWS